MTELVKFEFGGAHVSVIEVNGAPAFLVDEISTALGYADRALSVLLSRWSDEIIPGVDRIDPTPELLAALKAVGLVGARASTVGLLTESGLNLVLMKTEKQAGKVLRRKLATEILPQLRKTGRVELPGARPPTPLGKLTGWPGAVAKMIDAGWTPEQVALVASSTRGRPVPALLPVAPPASALDALRTLAAEGPAPLRTTATEIWYEPVDLRAYLERRQTDLHALDRLGVLIRDGKNLAAKRRPSRVSRRITVLDAAAVARVLA
jgi:prophage antirepressor-like protein